MGSVDLDLTRARFAGPIVVIELDMKFGSVDIRLPDGASASIDDVEVIVGSARDHRKDAPAEGRPHVILTGKVSAARSTSAGRASRGGRAAAAANGSVSCEPIRTSRVPPGRAADQLADQRCGVEVRNPFGDQAVGEREAVDRVPGDRLAAIRSAQGEFDEHLVLAMPDPVHVGVQVGHQGEQPLKRLPAGLLAAQGAHHGLDQHDVVAPQCLVLGQVGGAPGLGESFGESGGELLVNLIDGHAKSGI